MSSDGHVEIRMSLEADAIAVEERSLMVRLLEQSTESMQWTRERVVWYEWWLACSMSTQTRSGITETPDDNSNDVFAVGKVV